MTTTDELLIAVQHAVIDSIPTKKSEASKKAKAKIPFPTPVVKHKKISKEEAEIKFAVFGGVKK